MDYKEELLAFEKMLDKHEKLILRVVQNQIKDGNLHEDVYQEACLRIFRKIHPLMDMSPEQQQAHIVLMTRYAAIDYYRSTQKSHFVDMDDETLYYLLHQKEDREKAGISAQAKSELKMLLNHLSPEDRLLIVGKYYLGYSIAELTSITGGSAAQVKTKLHRAKKRLAEKWMGEKMRMEDFFDG